MELHAPLSIGFDVLLVPYSQKIWWEETLANLLHRILARKKVLQILLYRFVLDNDLADFSLAKHHSLANCKFTKVSSYTMCISG